MLYNSYIFTSELFYIFIVPSTFSAPFREWDAKIKVINSRKYMNKENYEKAVYQAYNDVMGAWMQKNASKYV